MNCLGTGELLLNRKKQSVALPLFIVFILLGVLIFFYFFAFIPIKGRSMENTIFEDQYCFVQRKGYSVSRGDIVIIEVPNDDDNGTHDIVKRVIGVAGDRLIFMRSANNAVIETYICKKGENHFNKLNESYIKEPMHNVNFHDTWVLQYDPLLTTYNLDTLDHQTYAGIDPFILYVPKNSIYFLGDNRNISGDSRKYGTRTLDKVKYKVIKVMY